MIQKLERVRMKEWGRETCRKAKQGNPRWRKGKKNMKIME